MLYIQVPDKAFPLSITTNGKSFSVPQSSALAADFVYTTDDGVIASMRKEQVCGSIPMYIWIIIAALVLVVFFLWQRLRKAGLA